MLKDYLKEKKISIYALAKKSEVPYSTLNDLCNGKVSIDNCKFGMVKKLADCLDLTLDEIVELANNRTFVHIDKYDMDAEILVKNKRYQVVFEYGGEPVNLDVCKVSENSSFYKDDITKWRAESYLDEKRIEEYENGVFSKEKR